MLFLFSKVAFTYRVCMELNANTHSLQLKHLRELRSIYTSYCIDRCILYIHLGITGVSTLSSKAQGPGEYVFTTVVGLQPCLPLPSEYLPQPSSLSPHWSLLHSCCCCCCSQLTQANTADTVFSLCKLSLHFLKNLHTFVLYPGPLQLYPLTSGA